MATVTSASMHRSEDTPKLVSSPEVLNEEALPPAHELGIWSSPFTRLP